MGATRPDRRKAPTKAVSGPARRPGEGAVVGRPGFCLFAKRLNQGRFVWLVIKDGVITLAPAQLAILLEGIDWRSPMRTDRPSAAA